MTAEKEVTVDEVQTLNVWHGFPQDLLNEFPVDLRLRVRQVNRDNIPTGMVTLVHVDQLEQLHEEGLDSNRLSAYLSEKPLVVYRTPGARLSWRCRHMFAWVFAEVDHGQWQGLREFLCDRQLKQDWPHLITEAYMKIVLLQGKVIEDITAEELKLPEGMRSHLTECRACQDRFDTALAIMTNIALPVAHQVVEHLMNITLGDMKPEA